MRSEILNKKVGEPITIVKPIGRGRLGTVFAGVHPVLARRFAIKVLLPRLTKDENVQRRLRRLVREASTIQHVGVVPLLDFGALEDGRTYLTMDYVRGIQLTKALDRDGRFKVERAIPILIQLADALEAAHVLRVFHGDVKPNNILLFEERDGRESLRLYDFKLMEALSIAPSEEDPLGHLRLYGNFDYLSPEQIANSRVDGRADIYAFGAVAYRMLCGEPPFFGTPEEVIQGHRSRDPVPPSRRAGAHDVPAELDAIILRCLEKRPEDRFKTMDEVSRELKVLAPKAPPLEPFEEEEITGRWKLPPEVEQEEPEEPLPQSPARLRELFYDTLIELADHAANQGKSSEELVYELSAVRRVKDEASQIAAEAAITENRFEDIRRELRERESTLRYAIIDLNLAKADLQDRGPDDSDLKDIEFQIGELERSLADLESQRGERFDRLNEQLRASREKLKSMEQELAVHYRRLYAFLDEARNEIQTDESRELYRLLDRCREALTQVVQQ
jgi:serine/threonine protein kinase